MVARIIFAGVLGLLYAVTPATAQSLADVAKREQARRDSVEAPGKAYTNADLTPDWTGPPAEEEPEARPAIGTEGTSEPEAGQDGESGEPAAAEAAVSGEPENTLDEAFWRGRASALRARVDSAREAFERVSRPSEGNERQQAKVAELRASAEGVLARAEAALVAFERQAQAQGVPEGWLR
jgi:hypothetical protein